MWKYRFKVTDGVTSSKLMITAMAASSFPSLEAEEVPGEFLLAFAAPWENRILPKVWKQIKCVCILFHLKDLLWERHCGAHTRSSAQPCAWGGGRGNGGLAEKRFQISNFLISQILFLVFLMSPGEWNPFIFDSNPNLHSFLFWCFSPFYNNSWSTTFRPFSILIWWCITWRSFLSTRAW